MAFQERSREHTCSPESLKSFRLALSVENGFRLRPSCTPWRLLTLSDSSRSLASAARVYSHQLSPQPKFETGTRRSGRRKECFVPGRS